LVRESWGSLRYEYVPSLAAGKVVLGFVIAAIVAVITESSETTSTAATREEKERSEIAMDTIIGYIPSADAADARTGRA
jgi:hypothetical protein